MFAWGDWLAQPLGWFVYNRARWQLTHPQRIVLVGYGIGGLVIKSFLAQVHKAARCDNRESYPGGDCKAFQENLQGIVFYAVPHSGSSADFAKYVKIWKNRKTSKPFLDLSVGSFHEFNEQMESLHDDFRRSIKEDTMIMAIVEGCPMRQEVQFHN